MPSLNPLSLPTLSWTCPHQIGHTAWLGYAKYSVELGAGPSAQDRAIVFNNDISLTDRLPRGPTSTNRARRLLRSAPVFVGALCQMFIVVRLSNSITHNPPRFQLDHPVAPALDHIHIVGGNHQDFRRRHQLLKPYLRLGHEIGISGAKPFIHQ